MSGWWHERRWSDDAWQWSDDAWRSRTWASVSEGTLSPEANWCSWWWSDDAWRSSPKFQARPVPHSPWGDYRSGQASAPLAEWRWRGAPGTGSARGRRPYKKEQKYFIQARKAFLRVYEEHLQSGKHNKIFDTVHVAIDVLSYHAYLLRHNEKHPDKEPLPR